MIGFNHGLVGGLIGYALPHYGLPYKLRDHSKLWKPLFIFDFFATAALIIIPVMTHQYAMLICGVLAVLPDFVWVMHFIKKRTFDLGEHTNWYTKYHAKIQRYERPWGVWIELPLAAILFYILLKISY